MSFLGEIKTGSNRGYFKPTNNASNPKLWHVELLEVVHDDYPEGDTTHNGPTLPHIEKLQISMISPATDKQILFRRCADLKEHPNFGA